MQYRPFGKTGEDISLLGFGAMRLPHAGDEVDLDRSVALLHRAMELGVNYLDSAPTYCGGRSEVAVGEAVRTWKGPRPLVSTKNPIEDRDGGHFRQRLEASLRRMGLEQVDFYHFWGISWQAYTDDIVVPGGPLDAARKARDEGLIRHISFSFHDAPENLVRLVDEGIFETVLCQYNLLDRSNEAGIAHAAARGLGVVIMGPVGGGRLGAPSEELQKLMPGRQSSAEVALRFVMSNPNVHCALSGMGTLEMVEENAAVASNASPLSEAEQDRIHRSLDENRRLAELYCTGCNYCMPCPFEVNIPLNFSLMNLHRVYGLTEHAQGQYAAIGTNPWMKGLPASACTECGVCETKCPQKIPIRKQLKETHRELSRP